MAVDALSGALGIALFGIFSFFAILVSLLLVFVCCQLWRGSRFYSGPGRHKRPPSYRKFENEIGSDLFRTKGSFIQPETLVDVELVQKRSFSPRLLLAPKTYRYFDLPSPNESSESLGEFLGDRAQLRKSSPFVLKDSIADDGSRSFASFPSSFDIYDENVRPSSGYASGAKSSEIKSPVSSAHEPVRTWTPGLTLKRSGSVMETGSGVLTFALRYFPAEQKLGFHLINGRMISGGARQAGSSSVVSIQIEGRADSELTSYPDDSPSPEFDQDFEIALKPRELLDSMLRLTVFDMLPANERIILGFIRFPLRFYSDSLVDGSTEGTGPISLEIATFLKPLESLPICGEIMACLCYSSRSDEVHFALRGGTGFILSADDEVVYLKASLLLDNEVVGGKKSREFLCAGSTFDIEWSCVFNALSHDMYWPMSDVAQTSWESPLVESRRETFNRMHALGFRHDSLDEVLIGNAKAVHSGEAKSSTMATRDDPGPSGSMGFKSLAACMGVMLSVRSKNGRQEKRVVGRCFLGDVGLASSLDGRLHWTEMLKYPDVFIWKKHLLIAPSAT